MQQLRETFPYEPAPQYLIFDRDATFDPEVVAAVRAMGSKPTRTSFQSPWQNGVSERWVGSCRRKPALIVGSELARVGVKRLLPDFSR